MKKLKRLMFLFTLMSAAGITYFIVMLKNIPDTFSWDLEEEENDESY
jgi:hypothetical protein